MSEYEIALSTKSDKLPRVLKYQCLLFGMLESHGKVNGP